MTPHRIQRRRTKGWRMPPNTVYVGRPTRWGNPFGEYWNWQALYWNMVRGCWDPRLVAGMCDSMSREVYERHVTWLKRLGRPPMEAARSNLRGHNLACWCDVTAACHADVLLALANGVEG